MDNNSKVAVGVLAGLAAGAVLGILFAPAKGSETRKNLTGKGKEYVDGLVNGVTETFTDLKNSVTESLGSAGDVVAELAEKAISRPETSKTDLKNTIASNDKNHQQSVTNQNRH